jgi:hypothetical protein
MNILISDFEVSVLVCMAFDVRAKFRIYARTHFNCSVENKTTQ